MKHRDFGHMDGPVVLFGGPYSNLQAMAALVSAIGDQDAVCTGDIVAYCAQPNETLRVFSKNGIPCVAGNCEAQLIENAEDCGCGFEADSACDVLAGGWWPYLRAGFDPEFLPYLEALPDIGSFVHQGRRYGVIHGGVRDISQFIWPSSPEATFRAVIAEVEAEIGAVDGIVAGHCGMAFHRMIGDHQWINTGAIGMPPHDGRPGTRFVVLENGEVTIHRLAYDYTATRAAMEGAGLTQGYHETLNTGVWPSEDVLPVELRR